MITAVQNLLSPTSAQATQYAPTSRYYGLATITMERAQGDSVIYLERRFVPAPESYQLLQLHTVSQGERLDNIAAANLGDPQAFWRICDANRAMRPEEMTETLGRQIRITLPAGISR